MRNPNAPQVLAAGSRIPFSPDLLLEAHPRREAGPVAPGLSAPPAAKAVGGSSLCVGHEARSASMDLAKAPSPETGVICGRKSVRGVVPDSRTAERIDQMLSRAGILLVLACVLFDAPYWIGQLLIAWGLA